MKCWLLNTTKRGNGFHNVTLPSRRLSCRRLADISLWIPRGRDALDTAGETPALQCVLIERESVSVRILKPRYFCSAGKCDDSLFVLAEAVEENKLDASFL